MRTLSPSRFVGLLATGLGVVASATAGSVYSWQHKDRADSWALTDVASIDYGAYHGVALQTDGTVRAWGTDYHGSTKVPANLTQMVKVSAGYEHSLCLRSSGTVRAWGANGYGQRIIPDGLQGVVDISAGWHHNLVVKTDGKVVGWGRNDDGQAKPPAGLTGVVKVAGGGFHSLALKSNGTVVAWGRNDYGQATVPAGLSNVVAIDAGYAFSVAVKADGTVVAWGSNFGGECNVPAGLTGVVKISAGESTVAALKSDGTVVGWGSPPFSQPAARVIQATDVAAGKLSDPSWFVGRSFKVRTDQTRIGFAAAATGYVDIGTPAPEGGAAVALSITPHLGEGLEVPATVTVPAGQSRASFPITGKITLGEERLGTIRSAYRSYSARTGEMIYSALGIGFRPSYSTVIAGSTQRLGAGFVLNQISPIPLVFDIVSESPHLVPSKTTVTIPAGQTSGGSVQFVHTPIDQTQIATFVRADLRDSDGQTVRRPITLERIKFDLDFLDDAQTMVAGHQLKATVRLWIPTREPAVVSLSSNSPVISVPATVTVPAGAQEVTFPIEGKAASSAELTVDLNGLVEKATISVRAPAVQAVSVPFQMPGNKYSTGSVYLDGLAPAGGLVVSLSSSNPAVRPALNVTVPEGAQSASFAIVSSDVAVPTSATITAASGSVSVQDDVLVQPLTVASLVLAASNVKGGGTVEATVSLDQTVGVNTLVTITSEDPAVVIVPSSTTVVKNTNARTFTIKTKAVGQVKYIRITVMKNGTSVYRTLKITP